MTSDIATGSASGRSETARLEAFSDAVIAIAMTILVLDLRVPILEVVTSKNLVSAILDQWPSYFAFALSFTTILIMWINHHARLSLVQRIDGLLMFANGFLMMAIVALSYPTALVGEYLDTAGRPSRGRDVRPRRARHERGVEHLHARASAGARAV